MNKFKYGGLAKEAGFTEIAPGMFSADAASIETLVDEVQRLTILNIITSLATVHDIMATSGKKVIDDSAEKNMFDYKKWGGMQ
jgi:hypothetical protein